MIEAVFETAAVSLGAVAPMPIDKKILLSGRSGKKWLLPVRCPDEMLFFRSPGVLHQQGFMADFLNRTVNRLSLHPFIIKQAGAPGHKVMRDYLPDKDDTVTPYTPVDPAPDVKAQIHLRPVPEPGNGDTEDPEIKGL